MNFKDLKSTQQLQTFLDGTQTIVYSVSGDKGSPEAQESSDQIA